MPSRQTEFIDMLLTRLERVPADSFWAHRASGVRGSLLSAIEREDAGQPVDAAGLDTLMKAALQILENAAAEKGRAATRLGAGAMLLD